MILLSGLPGTGKDTWIREHGTQLPIVSLDDLRRKMDVSPTDGQGRVAQAAQEQAKAYLRARQPFLRNATHLMETLRGKLIGMFEDYGAAVRIVYLETDWQENLRRNAERANAVPERVIENMLSKLVPPQRWEAQHVDWYCI